MLPGQASSCSCIAKTSPPSAMALLLTEQQQNKGDLALSRANCRLWKAGRLLRDV